MVTEPACFLAPRFYAPKEGHGWALIVRADVTRFSKDLMLLADVPVMFVKCPKQG